MLTLLRNWPCHALSYYLDSFWKYSANWEEFTKCGSIGECCIVVIQNNIQPCVNEAEASTRSSQISSFTGKCCIRCYPEVYENHLLFGNAAFIIVLIHIRCGGDRSAWVIGVSEWEFYDRLAYHSISVPSWLPATSKWWGDWERRHHARVAPGFSRRRGQCSLTRGGVKNFGLRGVLCRNYSIPNFLRTYPNIFPNREAGESKLPRQWVPFPLAGPWHHALPFHCSGNMHVNMHRCWRPRVVIVLYPHISRVNLLLVGN